MRNNIETGLDDKFARLKLMLAEISNGGKLAIAFSGGLDSRFLAHAARLAGLQPLLLHAQGPHMAERESRFATGWAKDNGMKIRLLEADPLGVPEVAANGRRRCYHCKHSLFTKLLEEAGGLTLCDGTQASDSGAYRPGMVALKELGIVSPLADSGLSKLEIRQMAAQSGMSEPEQRARPCLLTRFAYDLAADSEMLFAFDKAEDKIESLLQQHAEASDLVDAPDFRLRMLGPDNIELHLAARKGLEDAQCLGEGLLAALYKAVATSVGKPLASVRVMPSLSGFFDRE